MKASMMWMGGKLTHPLDGLTELKTLMGRASEAVATEGPGEGWEPMVVVASDSELRSGVFSFNTRDEKAAIYKHIGQMARKMDAKWAVLVVEAWMVRAPHDMPAEEAHKVVPADHPQRVTCVRGALFEPTRLVRMELREYVETSVEGKPVMVEMKRMDMSKGECEWNYPELLWGRPE